MNSILASYNILLEGLRALADLILCEADVMLEQTKDFLLYNSWKPNETLK